MLRAASKCCTQLTMSEEVAVPHPHPQPHPLTSDDIVDAALGIVESAGITGLTMRKLAAELGVAVTAIYWHVGNRDALLDALVDREMAEMEAICPSGTSPGERILSVAATLRQRLLARRHIVELIHERGHVPNLLVPVHVLFAQEFLSAGLSGERAALAVRTLQLHVIGSVILQRWSERQYADVPLEPMTEQVMKGIPADPAAVSEAARLIPGGQVFMHATALLIEGLLAGD